MVDVNQIIPVFIGQIERYNQIVSAGEPSTFEDQRALLNSLSRLMAFGEVLPAADQITTEESPITPDKPRLADDVVQNRFPDFAPYAYIPPFGGEDGAPPAAETKSPATDIIGIHTAMNEVLAFFEARQPAAALKHAADQYPAWGRQAIDLKSYLHAYFYDH